MNSQCHAVWKIVWILISWLLKEPADLNLFSIELLSGFILFLKSLCMVINKGWDKLGSLCIISSLGQVKFSLDKYIMFI